MNAKEEDIVQKLFKLRWGGGNETAVRFLSALTFGKCAMAYMLRHLLVITTFSWYTTIHISHLEQIQSRNDIEMREKWQRNHKKNIQFRSNGNMVRRNVPSI